MSRSNEQFRHSSTNQIKTPTTVIPFRQQHVSLSSISIPSENYDILPSLPRRAIPLGPSARYHQMNPMPLRRIISRFRPSGPSPARSQRKPGPWGTGKRAIPSRCHHNLGFAGRRKKILIRTSQSAFRLLYVSSNQHTAKTVTYSAGICL